MLSSATMRIVSHLALLACLAPRALAAADTSAVEPDTLRTYATLHSLGFEWDVAGDDDHDAGCRVRYRAEGDAEWKTALDLLRVDFEGGRLEVREGQAIMTHPGEWVRYSTPEEGGAEYISICLPAFSPEMVHRDPEPD